MFYVYAIVNSNLADVWGRNAKNYHKRVYVIYGCPLSGKQLPMFGGGSTLGAANVYTYRTPDFMLSSTQSYRGMFLTLNYFGTICIYSYTQKQCMYYIYAV